MKTPADMTILIVGLGQIGGSLGLDLVRRRLVRTVRGYDSDQTVARHALERSAIHDVASTLDEGCATADLVILAAPIRQSMRLLPDVLTQLDRESAVLDVCSTKEEMHASYAEHKLAGNYIGGHPLTGCEKVGFAAARRGLFEGRTFVLAPAEDTSPGWLAAISDLVFGLGAKPLVMNAAEHDRLFALTSGLPHVFALALCRLALQYGQESEFLYRLCGGSFRSAVRVAGSSPDLIIDMFLTNRGNICRCIDHVIVQLNEIRESVNQHDEQQLRAVINGVQRHCPGLSDE